MAQMQVPQIYRGFLRALRNYPSIKKDAMIVAVKEEFRENATEADPDKAAEQRQYALMELERLSKYSGNTSGADIDIQL